MPSGKTKKSQVTKINARRTTKGGQSVCDRGPNKVRNMVDIGPVNIDLAKERKRMPYKKICAKKPARPMEIRFPDAKELDAAIEASFARNRKVLEELAKY